MNETRKPAAGDLMWWRGLRGEVVAVDEGRGVFTYHAGGEYTNESGKPRPRFRCTSALAEVKYDAVLELWYLPDTTGELPRYNKNGELVEPDPQTCKECGAITWRAEVCTNCRLAAAGGGN